MKGASITLMCIGVMALVSACSELASLTLTGSLERPEAVVSDQSDGRLWRRACVDRVELWRERSSSREFVWSIRAAGDECVWLERVVYGEVPEGFVETTPAQALTSDVRYTVLAHGWKRGFGAAPWVAGGDYVFAEGGWREGAGNG